MWECISWIPGFNGKTRRNKNDFFWRCHVWKITIFSQPRGGQKRHFSAQFFFFEYRFWSQVGASGVVNLSFLRMYGEKIINFPAQWHIKEFYRFKLFEFWIFCFKSLLWLFGSVFHGSQGFIGKMRRNENDFFSRGVMCEKLPFFHSPAVVRKGTFLHNFFFSEYRFWSQVGASGVVYLSFLRIYGEKNDKFSSTMTY